MAITAPSEPIAGWKRFLAKIAAFGEAAEMGGFTYHDLKIADLEQRIAALETARATGAETLERN